MHAIERDLIKASGYKAQRKFADRQDYLKSILNAVSKLEDDDFNVLKDEAADWVNAAVEAVNSRDDIPDFDEDTTQTEDDPEPEDAAVADSEDGADDDDEEDDGPSDDDDEPADDVADVQAVDEQPEEKPAKKVKKPAKPVKAALSKKPIKGQRPPQFDQGDVVLDKWGSMEGSKNSQALTMFEKGATSKEVKEVLGGTYYNILKKVVKAGHTLEKKGSMIKVTHSDDVNTKPKKAAKK